MSHRLGCPRNNSLYAHCECESLERLEHTHQLAQNTQAIRSLMADVTASNLQDHIARLKRESDYDAALTELAREQDMTEDAVMRCALRLYQMHNVRRKQGFHIVWLDEEGNPFPEMTGGCSAMD